MIMKTLSIILFLALAASSIQAQRIKGSDTVLPIAQQTAERFPRSPRHCDRGRHRCGYFSIA